MFATAWPWLALILLGAWHGLNPGMGWLFSVALGLQRRSRTAVFAALVPIALGHALAIGLVVFVVYVIGAVVPFRWLQIVCAATLFGIASWKLYRFRHPSWVGMCVNFWDLTLWSCLMASAHGAGGTPILHHSITPLLHYSTTPPLHDFTAPPRDRKKLLLLPTGLVVLTIPMQVCSPQMFGSEMLQTPRAFDAFFYARCCRRDS